MLGSHSSEPDQKQLTSINETPTRPHFDGRVRRNERSAVADILPLKGTYPAALVGSEQHIFPLRVQRLSTEARDVPRRWSARSQYSHSKATAASEGWQS